MNYEKDKPTYEEIVEQLFECGVIESDKYENFVLQYRK